SVHHLDTCRTVDVPVKVGRGPQSRGMAQILSPVRPVRTIATRTQATTASLVTLPAVVGHRGASGHRPEHTIDAFRTAIRMGADEIELDLVISGDRVLLVRHENELSRSTDVAHHPRFAR